MRERTVSVPATGGVAQRQRRRRELVDGRAGSGTPSSATCDALLLLAVEDQRRARDRAGAAAGLRRNASVAVTARGVGVEVERRGRACRPGTAAAGNRARRLTVRARCRAAASSRDGRRAISLRSARRRTSASRSAGSRRRRRVRRSAMSGGMTSVRCPPTFMPATPSSQPLITRPPPRREPNG